MRIEIATTRAVAPKEKGDLLEDLAAELLGTQTYDVEQQVRLTATELDLLGRHRINNRQIYVECKAHREPLSANALKNLLGTVTFKEYAEGWLISTGPLGKDAKGFKVEWESKPQSQREQLSIYTPERVIRTLTDARLLAHPPTEASLPTAESEFASLGDWTLLITEHGRFWVQTVLLSGAPEAVQVFAAEKGQLITDPILLRRLGATDSTLSTLDFEYRANRRQSETHRLDEDRHEKVIQVQHGERWSDYRPSRPEDFVGRNPAQDSILKLLNAVRSRESPTRVFAVTGDSGMGKSSLIAKLCDRTRNIRNRKKFFIYAVDVRAATRPAYILWSLLACLRSAVDSAFIDVDGTELKISDHSQPLASPSIQKVLQIAAAHRRVICLVFDQFEELYSKPEMFPVFEEAQRLFLSAVSAESNLVLGFAWRTDSTVQQNHPAYFMWHRLADHRFEVPVGPFGHSEASTAITVFERELGQKLIPGIRRQIIENSQGYPWLLKKLCIHLYDQLKSGGSQARLVDTLDVQTLFNDDLKVLSQPELNCVRLIAAQAPADWHEVLDAASADVLRSLQDRRLVVRSGDRLNLYWDLFREFVLTGNVPSVPFTYVPSAPSLGSFLAVAEELTKGGGSSFEELSGRVDLKVGTVQNIVHDLVMFGIARESAGHVFLASEMASAETEAILERVRAVLRRHALYIAISSFDEGHELRVDDLIRALQHANPTAHHRSETWKLYAERMAHWLCTAGLLEVVSNGWGLHDRGKPLDPSAVQRRRLRRKAFQGEAPPKRVVACLAWIARAAARTKEEVKDGGYRNAVGVLIRFGLIEVVSNGSYKLSDGQSEGPADQLVWGKAWCDPTIREVREWLAVQPSISGRQVGEKLAESYGEQWSPASVARIGNGVRRWASWLLAGQESASPPPIPVTSRRTRILSERQMPLFEKVVEDSDHDQSRN